MKSCYTDIDIILADDHELFRKGFALMIKQNPGINLVAEAKDGNELINYTIKFNPNVIVTDIYMPVKDGIEATKYITNHFPHIAVIALSMFEESHLITDILNAGAKGYLVKNAEQYEIIEGIKSVHAGRSYYCRHAMKRFNEIRAMKNSEPDFSAREIIIIKLICNSCTSQEIGEQLQLSKRTVEGYRERIMQRLEIDKPIDLLRYAIKHKIYQLDIES